MQLEGKTVAKTVNYFTSESSILSSVAQEGGQLPDEKYDALPLRAEKLSLPQSGDSDWRWRNGQPGHPAGYPVCSVAEKNTELERELASQSEELVDLQANLLSILREKSRQRGLILGAW